MSRLSYRGPATLEALRMVLMHNTDFDYQSDAAFHGGGGWIFVVKEKQDQSLQRLLYTNSDDDPNAWVFAEKFPVVLTK